MPFVVADYTVIHRLHNHPKEKEKIKFSGLYISGRSKVKLKLGSGPYYRPLRESKNGKCAMCLYDMI